MKSLQLRDRRDRWIPRWLQFAALGVGLSFLSAMCHFGLAEAGYVGRPGRADHNAEFSGEFLARWARERWTGEPAGPTEPRVKGYDLVAYGWPIPAWGSLFRLVHPIAAPVSTEPVVGVDCRPLWKPVGPDEYQRIIPIFPLLGQLIVSASLWGGAIWLGVGVNRRVRNRRLGIVPCEKCGYDLSGLPAGNPCPECGAEGANAP